MNKTRLIDAVLTTAGRILYALFSLFGWRLVSVAGTIAGNVLYAVDRKRRAIVEGEVAILLGSQRKRPYRSVVKRTFITYYIRQVETIFLGVMHDTGHLQKQVDLKGLRHLNQALGRKRGVILLLSHFGSFLLPLPALGYRGFPVNQVTGKQIHTSLAAERIWLWRKKEADKLPVNFIQVGTFLRPIFRALKKNEIVALAFDGRDGVKWVDSDFLASRAYFSTGPFELARRTGATIVPAFVFGQKDDRYRIVLHEPFNLSQDPDPDTALKADVRGFARLLGEYVAHRPCHFAMILHNYRKFLNKGFNTRFFVEK